MKKLLVPILACVIVLGGFSTNAQAATKNEDNIVVSDDKKEIVYDTKIVNGGIDLETKLDIPHDQLIDKKNVPTTRAGSVIISIPFQTQQNNYYCGPAAARMVLGGIGYSVTQNQMANLLGTTTNGTNAGNSVANALNAIVEGSKYQFRWQWHTYTDIATIKSHVVEALNYGNPVMVNTMESPGDVYLVGHNIGTTLYHYGVVADYFDYGNSVTYTDPGYGRFSGFVMDQKVSITNLSYACGGRGYAW